MPTGARVAVAVCRLAGATCRCSVLRSHFPRLLRWSDVRDSSHQGSWNELDQFVDCELAVVLVFVERARDLAIAVGVIVRFLGMEDLAVYVLRRVGAQVRA